MFLWKTFKIYFLKVSSYCIRIWIFSLLDYRIKLIPNIYTLPPTNIRSLLSVGDPGNYCSSKKKSSSKWEGKAWTAQNREHHCTTISTKDLFSGIGLEIPRFKRLCRFVFFFIYDRCLRGGQPHFIIRLERAPTMTAFIVTPVWSDPTPGHIECIAS